MSRGRSDNSQVASSVPFDNTNTNFISDNVEGAIKEINSSALAGGRVNSNGTSNRILNASTTRNSVGNYTITFDTPVTDADYPVIITLQANAGDDDFIVSYTNLSTTGFDVLINEQDNGGTAGVPRDNEFSFLVPNISTQSGPENDHGALVGLGDDDHPQYFNQSRGDARYYTQAQIDAQQLIQDNNLTDHLNDTIDAHDASSISFDNSTNGFDSDNVQDALEEIGASASPGYSFGRNGALSQNTWLRRPGNVPSNRAGVTVDITNPVVTKVAVANRNVETFTVEIYEHEGNQLNLTLLGSVKVVNNTSQIFNVNFPATQGRQIAVRLGTTSSGNVRDLGVDVTLTGSA